MPREASRFSTIVWPVVLVSSCQVQSCPLPLKLTVRSPSPDPGTPLSKGDSNGGGGRGSGLSCWLPYEFYVIITNGLVAQGKASGPFWEVVFEGIRKIE